MTIRTARYVEEGFWYVIEKESPTSYLIIFVVIVLVLVLVNP